MTDAMFNELLDVECRQVASFYQLETHYEPYEYMRVAGENAAGTTISFTEVINPGDKELIPLMRRIGAWAAMDHADIDPLAIFVVQAQLAIHLDSPGQGMQKVLTIYGVTNDGRYNMAVIPGQWDEDDRLYAVPTDVMHWSDAPNFHVKLLPYMEFFRVNDQIRIKELA
jgi:hypothetical protein